jgi:hypothetical protein
VAIRDLQVRSVRVGRCRAGQKVQGQPSRLDTFRFTSPAEHLIEEIAALYGGKMVVWGDSPRNKQWEVVTDAAMIPVFIPPQKVDPFYEQWGKDVCVRRCDGFHDTIHDVPCDCNPERRKCKPTTRVSLMLADVPGLGVWGLESHGIYFAGEMVQLFDTIQGVRVPLPARLLLENRVSKQYDRVSKRVVVKDYNVPVLLLDGVTSRVVQVGTDAVSQALALGREQQALAAQERAAIEPLRATAIEAAPATAPPAPNIPKALEAIAKATTNAEMAGIRKRIKETGDHQQLIDAWHARSQVLTAQRTQEAEAQRAQARVDAKKAREARLDAQGAWQDAPEEPDDPTDPPVNSEAVPEPPATSPWKDGGTHEQGVGDGAWEGGEPEETIAATDEPQARKSAMMQLLGEAGGKLLKTSDLDRMAQDEFGVGLQLITVAQMQALGAKLQ